MVREKNPFTTRTRGHRESVGEDEKKKKALNRKGHKEQPARVAKKVAESSEKSHDGRQRRPGL
jgi:hypothetical protein